MYKRVRSERGNFGCYHRFPSFGKRMLGSHLYRIYRIYRARMLILIVLVGCSRAFACRMSSLSALSIIFRFKSPDDSNLVAVKHIKVLLRTFSDESSL